MKTCLSAGWAAALLLVLTSTAGHAAEPRVAYRADRELSAASLLLPVGTPRASVLQLMGAPDARLSRDVWVYWNHRLNRSERNPDYDTLVIVFSEDRAALMKLVSGAVVRRLLAEQARRHPATIPAPIAANTSPRR